MERFCKRQTCRVRFKEQIDVFYIGNLLTINEDSAPYVL